MTLIASVAISVAQNKTGTVVTGTTTLKYPINFTAADTIDASETYWVLVDCKQNYLQTQSVAITMATVTATPSVSVSLEAKTSTLDSYVEVVSPTTWTSSSNNPISLVTTTPNNYRYFKIKFVASGASQKSKVTGLTFTCTYSNQTNISATTGTFSGALTAGGLITANNGLTLGAGDNLVGSSTSSILMNTNKFTVAGSSGNTAIAGTLAVTGTQSNTALITANSGIVSTGYNFASSTVVGGTGNAITMDFTPDFPTLSAGLAITFVAEGATTTNTTLAIDGGTAKSIKEYNGAISELDANDIRSGQVVTIVYDGTQWVMMSPSGN